MSQDIQALTEQIQQASAWTGQLRREIAKVIIGQNYLVERLLIGLLGNGHVLLEGVPGLAKTLSVSSLAKAIHAHFSRIQFTPDLLPGDIVGTLIYNPASGEFITKHGPVFANIVLADEINRAPAKVQSALLEAMQEKQVTIGDETHLLPSPFLVLATENPIDQEGTYPLPEAQMDRFMLKLKIGYPTPEEERQILDTQAHTYKADPITPIISPEDILSARALVDQVYIDDKIKDYIVTLVYTTRSPADYKQPDLAPFVQNGASPRATIALALASRAYAFLQGRAYVTPEDIEAIAMDVLRHRIITTYEADAEEVTTEDIVKKILTDTPKP